MELDADRRLALAYAPASARPALAALWRLDVTLGAVLAGRRDPLAAELRLAWWREALARLDAAPPPAEPVLQGLAACVLPAGVTGAALAAMEEGWLTLLADGPLGAAALAAYADARGGALFRHSARLLGLPDHPVEAAGRRWALVDLARRSATRGEAIAALAAAAAIEADRTWPQALRALGMLSILARRDLARGPDRWDRPGSPRRTLRMLQHRLTGN
jgi:15-cis-phytoene synthase